jgi:hypothetical protein
VTPLGGRSHFVTDGVRECKRRLAITPAPTRLVTAPSEE